MIVMSLPGFTADKPLQFQYTGNLRSIAEYEQEYKSVTVQPNQPARERGLYDCIMCGTHIYYCNEAQNVELLRVWHIGHVWGFV